MRSTGENFVVDDFAARSAAANLSKVRTFRLQTFSRVYKYPSLVLRPSQLSQDPMYVEISKIINSLSSLETAQLFVASSSGQCSLASC